jgi:hypothetical protein
MSYFALVLDNVVQNVIVVDRAALNNLTFPESEPVGQAFIATCPDLAAQEGTWWQCSYEALYRAYYPGVAYTFDGVNFAPPSQPEPVPTADDYTVQPEPVIEAP